MALIEQSNLSSSPTTNDNIGNWIPDLSSHYHHHHFENLGITLVSQLLNGDNSQPGVMRYCKSAMRTALSAKSKICFIDGSLDIPAPSSATFFSSMHCNDMVKSWIVNSLSREISDKSDRNLGRPPRTFCNHVFNRLLHPCHGAQCLCICIIIPIFIDEVQLKYKQDTYAEAKL
ncbi:hypothetical protein L1049_018671 [Liquidambar formosana]|uniref:Retrotransposon Copia-like N-terminal domain-containing protein n=1 Tax=Liquidambar formosana TaxID=63359 RepID=A0AAP0RAE7_LIQFO